MSSGRRADRGGDDRHDCLSRTVPERSIVFAVGRDVTDRRRADAELRTLITAAIPISSASPELRT
jgi:hypothetical protein